LFGFVDGRISGRLLGPGVGRAPGAVGLVAGAPGLPPAFGRVTGLLPPPGCGRVPGLFIGRTRS
jgi:hypothetical protein